MTFASFRTVFSLVGILLFASLTSAAPTVTTQPVSSVVTVGGTASFSFVVTPTTGTTYQWAYSTDGGTTFANVPTTAPYSGGTTATLTITSATATMNSYRYRCVATNAGTAQSAAATLNVIQDLNWDAGTTDGGTQYSVPSPNPGGTYYFKITTAAPAVGAWRTALRVASGTADVYLKQSSVPTSTTDGGISYRSERAGTSADGFVVPGTAFSVGQAWYLMVVASTNAQWSLVSGDVYVKDLGALPDAPPTVVDISGNRTVGGEGMAFYKTTVPANTPAWALWARTYTDTAPGTATSLSKPLQIRKLQVPVGNVRDQQADTGQMLVVPPYLTAAGDTYYIAVTADPGTKLNLASYRQTIVTDTGNVGLPFTQPSLAVNLPADSFQFTTWKISVPDSAHAWDLTTTSAAGNLQLCVRRGNVPNASENDGYSEAPTGVADSLTLVATPSGPSLASGDWYVTVWADRTGTPPSLTSGTLSCGPPTATDISFVSTNTNNLPTKAGWKYYRIGNDTNQLGYLGWDILLTPPVGTPVGDYTLALRQNDFPSRWQYRSGGSSSGSANVYTASSTFGEIQRPGHQQDTWYIGVYRSDQKLDSFVLETKALPAKDEPGVDFVETVTAQAPELWKYYKIEVTQAMVDAGLLGWDLRLTNVTAGTNPRLSMANGVLPPGGGFPGQNQPNASLTWPSGAGWAAADDLTGLNTEPNGDNTSGRVLHMAVGRPLVPGTYYVGIANPGAVPTSYTFKSRGIYAPSASGGDANSLRVQTLAFSGTGSSLSLPVLAPRELAYYRVSLSAPQKSWRVRLAATTGEVSLAICRDYLPAIGLPSAYFGTGSVATTFGANNSSGILMRKVGAEQFVMLPTYASGTNSSGQPTVESTLPTGNYYLAVISSGVTGVGAAGTNGAKVGTGDAAFTLTSQGDVAPTLLGNLTAAVPDLALTGQSLEEGAVKHYEFVLPAGLQAVEVRLEAQGSNPAMLSATAQAGRLVKPVSGYGLDGNYYGSFPVFNDGRGGSSGVTDVVTLTNLTAGTYSIAVSAPVVGSGGGANSSYTVHVRSMVPTILAGDPASATVVNQPINSFRYFRVDVPPTNAPPGILPLGWELRLTNVTGGTPTITVRRDSLPDTFRNSLENQNRITTWPSNLQMTWATDLTGYQKEANGDEATYRLLHVAMGQPLEPGTYYVGVTNESAQYVQPMSYTIQSRFLWSDAAAMPASTLAQQIVKTLAFSGTNSADVATLAPRDLRHYRVNIPTGKKSWRVRLDANTGEVALAIRKGVLPSIGATVGTSVQTDQGAFAYSSGALMRKAGYEHFVLLPSYAPIYTNGVVTGIADTIPSGDYFLTVISQGGTGAGGTDGQRIGTLDAAYTITSLGEETPTSLGNFSPTVLELTANTQDLESGRVRHYSFTVPSNLSGSFSSIQASMENRTGDPWFTLAAAPDQLVEPASDPNSYPGTIRNGYGIDALFHGATGVLTQGNIDSSSNLLTLSSPAPGTYTLAVRAIPNENGTGGAATFNLRVTLSTPTPLAFDGGNAPLVVDQAPQTWKYYKVIVPDGPGPTGSTAKPLGWDLRLSSVGRGKPRVVVQRDSLPNALSTTDGWPRGANGNAVNRFSYPAADRWPTGYRVYAGDSGQPDLSGFRYDASGMERMGQCLILAMGRPLEPGTYLVGVTGESGSTDPMTYQLQSYGIWDGSATGFAPDPAKPTETIAVQGYIVRTLTTVGGSATFSALEPREHMYYRVKIPSDQTSWQVKLSTTTGDATFGLRKDFVPGATIRETGAAVDESSNYGVFMNQPGNEHYVLFPAGTATTIPAGDYFMVVTGQGATGVGATGPSGLSQSGTGNATYMLTSRGPVAEVDLGTLATSGAVLTRTDTTQPDTLESGEIRFYRFVLPAGLDAVQVELANKVGSPWMAVSATPGAYPRNTNFTTDTRWLYGTDQTGTGDTTASESDGFITMTKPAAGVYHVSVRASNSPNPNTPSRLPATFRVNIRNQVVQTLNFAGAENSPPRKLGDGEKAFYKITIPGTGINFSDILGWTPRIALTSGNLSWQIRKGFPPSAEGSFISKVGAGRLTLPPPYLTPGDWYIEVTGIGLAEFTITSEQITLRRPAWEMPAVGATTSTSLFADSGLDSQGQQVGTDGGTDLGAGESHYYAFTVPENNAGLIRVQLVSLNGDLKLDINPATVPSGDTGTSARHRFSDTGTQYGALVPDNTRVSSALIKGIWYAVVTAPTTANVRYRLRLAHGNPVRGGIVTGLSFSDDVGDGDELNLAKGDWHFYRIEVPADAPTSWQFEYTHTGDVDLFVRDGAPPGFSGNVSTTNTDASVRDWRSDNLNQGPYDWYPTAGTHTFKLPPIRPGGILYLGFRAIIDSTYKITIPPYSGSPKFVTPPSINFYGGNLNNITVPAGGILVYKMKLDADAARLKMTATNPTGIEFFLEEGTPVDLTRLDVAAPHWRSYGSANASLNTMTNGWPWRPGKTFYLTVRNTTASAQAFSLTMNGKSVLTDDEDGDGIPDAWEIQYFGDNINTYGADSDPDGDGSTNLQEYQNGTDPTNPNSVKYQLTLGGVGTTVTAVPNQTVFNKNSTVSVTATATAGLTFLGWAPSPKIANVSQPALTTNPLALTMDGNKSAIGFAGLPLADALDTTGLGWTTGGDRLWFGQTATT